MKARWLQRIAPATAAALLVAASVSCSGSKAPNPEQPTTAQPKREQPKSDAPKFRDSRDANMTPEQIAAREKRRDSTVADIMESGVKAGDRVPALKVLLPDGSEKTLAEFCRGKPTILVTASLTCGRSRERQPQLDRLAEKYKDRINVAVVYTLEAHPTIDPSPYAKYSPELENPAHPGERSGGNEKAGLLRRQPRNVEDRRKLAREFQSRLQVKVPILLDEMSNEAWKSLGGGPNVGILVSSDGKIVVKHAWFEGESMDKSVEALLAQPAKTTAATGQ